MSLLLLLWGLGDFFGDLAFPVVKGRRGFILFYLFVPTVVFTIVETGGFERAAMLEFL